MNLEVIRSKTLPTIMQFSIPAIIAMVLTSLINVADGFFIGNYVGNEGLAALNLGLPIIYLYLAVGLMVSVGGVAIAGMALGAGNTQKCNHVFNQTLLTCALVTALLSGVVAVFLIFITEIPNTNAAVTQHFKDYYAILLAELPIMVINNSFGMFIRSEGEPQFFMKVSTLNVLLNIVLDYLFVRWFSWGVKGVAVASLIAAIVTLALIINYFVSKSKVYKFQRFTFSAEVFKSTMINGGSEFIGEMSMCISMFAYNLVILKQAGVEGVTAFTIVGYVAYIFSMIIIGFGQGIVPLISFSYGAKEYPLARFVRKTTNLIVFAVGAAVLLLCVASSQWYSQVFIKSEAVIAMVRSGVIIFSVSFPFSGINTITSFYFTATGKAMESAVISSSRGLVLLLICIFTLPMLWGMTGVWLVAPITELLTLFISAFFIIKERYPNERENLAEA